VENDPALKAQRVNIGGSCTFYLGFNNAVKPFDNKQVRQAFATALNREAWVRDILKGLGKPAYSFIPPGFPGHDPSEQSWTFNKEQAQQLLNASGFDKNQTLKLTYASTARNKARNEYLASMLQENLGIKIQLDPVDPTQYSSLFKKAETTPPMFILGWCADYPDPQDWTSLVFQTGGISAGRIQWSNKQLDQLTQQADRLKVDDPQRAQLHLQAQKLLVQEAPVAFFWHDVSPVLVKPWVKNVHQTPLDWFPGIFDLGSIEIAHQ
jgi:oligopeptide transport system substrate-binding protein